MNAIPIMQQLIMWTILVALAPFLDPRSEESRVAIFYAQRFEFLLTAIT
jgi:hypothetical protein